MFKFLLKIFPAIMLAVTFSIYVEAETHTISFINKYVAFVDSSFDRFLLTRELLDAALVLYVMNKLDGMTIFNLFFFHSQPLS